MLVLGAIAIFVWMSLYVYEKYEKYESDREKAKIEKEFSDVITELEKLKEDVTLAPKRSLEALDAFRKTADKTQLERAQVALENERQARRKFAAPDVEYEDKRYTNYNMNDYPRTRFEAAFPSLRGIRAMYSTQPSTIDDFAKTDWMLVREWMYALLQRTDFSIQEKAQWVNKYFDNI